MRLQLPPQLDTEADALRGALHPPVCVSFFSAGARVPFETQPPHEDTLFEGAAPQLVAGRRAVEGSGLGAVRLMEVIERHASRAPRPDASGLQAPKPSFAVSFSSLVSATGSRSATFLIRTQLFPIDALGSASLYRSAT